MFSMKRGRGRGRGRGRKRILSAAATLALAVPIPATHVPAGTTEQVREIQAWVQDGTMTSTDQMFATLEAYGYDTTGLSMGHDISRCGPGAAGCALFAPDGTQYIIMDADYVGSRVGLFILAHEYRHAVKDLRSETLAVDECNADRFAEAVVPGIQGAYTMCDTHGVPFEGADFHEPITFQVVP